jgi:hypothetical protein
VTGYDLIVDIYPIRLILNKISFSCNVVWIKWGDEFRVEKNHENRINCKIYLLKDY